MAKYLCTLIFQYDIHKMLCKNNTYYYSSALVAQLGRAPTIQSAVVRLVMGSIHGRDLRERNTFAEAQKHNKE